MSLFETVYSDNYVETQTLLEQGADPDVLQEGETPLTLAVTNSNISISELLLKFGANPNLGTTFPLLIAVTNGESALTKLLLENKANPNIDMQLTTPLHQAVLGSNTDIVTLLLKFGAFTNIQDGRSNTPLHYSIYRGNFIISKLLVDNRADSTIKDFRGKSPIDYAKFFDLLVILKLFIPNMSTNQNYFYNF